MYRLQFLISKGIVNQRFRKLQNRFRSHATHEHVLSAVLKPRPVLLTYLYSQFMILHISSGWLENKHKGQEPVLYGCATL